MAAQRLFLERRSYRRRRLMDLVRLLPVLGLGLFMLPLMWSGADEGAPQMGTARALIYLFGAWITLTVLAFLLWRRTHSFAEKDPMQMDAETEEEPQG
ncbi:MAG: hypothetical protein P1U53_16025 [Sulfitobacter sp.]|nr:hypothetical protein [Sulfitobacter sp.]